MRILLVCSSGGHLDQLMLLEDWLNGNDVAIATFAKPDAMDRIGRWRFYGLKWPTNRHLPNLVVNTFRAIRILRKERPDVVISSGAAAAVPFFYLSRLRRRTATVFVECYDRMTLPTMTARLVRPVADAFVVQWPGQLEDWPRRFNLGESR